MSALDCAAICSKRSGSSVSLTGCLSMNIAPVSSIETSIGFWSWSSALARLSGRFTGTPEVSSGAVTMKMISSTSITSTSGVTLISAIAARRFDLPRPRDED